MPRVAGEAQEVARAEAQAVLAMVQDEGRRAHWPLSVPVSSR